MNKAEKEKTKTDNSGSTKDGEKTVVKAEIRVRKRVFYLSDEIKSVVTVANDGRPGECLKAFFVIFDFSLDAGCSFQFGPLPRLAGK